ncbi:MAG: MFS transporter, partial [Chloroflexota bacterium]|nr:MFS transporter [Chloroflexota bacterium]
LTHSALALGLIGLFRVIPIVLFSLLGGVVADVISRRKLLLVTQSMLVLVSVALAATTILGLIAPAIIYLLTGIAAGVAAFDSPARQALVPSLVPPKRLTNALSISSTAFQVATVIGPSLAGIIIATRGVAAVYLIDVVSFLAVLLVLFLIRPPMVEGAVQRVSLAAAAEGLHFVWRSPIILATMGLDFVATFFGSATALLPIFARDILHVGPTGYGPLYAAPSAGAVLAGVMMSFVAGRIRAQGKVILVAVAAYAAFTILFGLSRVFLLSLLFLAGVGASDTVSMILRQTVRQSTTPDALRGRMTSVNMVFFMGGPQLGEFEAGVVARLGGAPLSVVTGGIAALLLAGVIALTAGRLRAYRV